jgi:hypothetical protein
MEKYVQYFDQRMVAVDVPGTLKSMLCREAGSDWMVAYICLDLQQ